MTETDGRFLEVMRETLGAEEAAALVAALDTEPVTAVRLNPRKVREGEPLQVEEAFAQGKPVAWCRDGLVLGSRPQFTLMPEWHGGLFYVQEPASMVIGEVVRRLCGRIGRSEIRYLDTCAAPGGKTTAALSALPDGAFVVANEFLPSRANILLENLTKWGAPNVAVTCGDTAAFRKLPVAFDIVAVDAPCSGEGMMRKDEEARRQWSEGLVKQCAALQHEIVENAWTALRPGGYLIYSTCTFNRNEDEEMLRYIVEGLGGESIDTGIGSDFDIPGAIVPGLHALRFMPHRNCGEGLFMGVMRKPEEAIQDAPKANKKKGKKKTGASAPDLLPHLLQSPEDFWFSQSASGIWRGVTRAHVEFVTALEDTARVMSAGVALGQTKGKDFIPDPALALSTAASGAFQKVDVDLDTALNYLRREAVTLPAETPRGYVTVCYRGLPLGFMKHLGNRSNNLYPQHWRIRNL